MSLKESVTKAIQDNLPQAVATELSTYIQQAEKDKVTIKDLEISNRKLFADLNELLEYKNKHKDLSKIECDLSLRKSELDIKENNLKVIIADMKVVEAEKRADATFKLAEIVFKNRSLTKNTDGSYPVAYPGSNGYPGSVGTGHMNVVTKTSDAENDTI